MDKATGGKDKGLIQNLAGQKKFYVLKHFLLQLFSCYLICFYGHGNKSELF